MHNFYKDSKYRFDFGDIFGPVPAYKHSNGWSIYFHNRRFDFDYEDEDYGSTSIKNLLEHLGYKVSVEEVS